MTCAMDIFRDDHLTSTETGASAINIDPMACRTNVGGDSQGRQRYTGPSYRSDTKVPKSHYYCSTASGSRMAQTHERY